MINKTTIMITTNSKQHKTNKDLWIVLAHENDLRKSGFSNKNSPNSKWTTFATHSKLFHYVLLGIFGFSLLLLLLYLLLLCCCLKRCPFVVIVIMMTISNNSDSNKQGAIFLTTMTTTLTISNNNDNNNDHK